MAKKDTYLALLRRGIDENTAQILSEGGIKVGDLKDLDVDTLVNNYGLKKEIAKSVLDAVISGPRASSKQRYLADILSDGTKKKVDKIDEQRFKREQKDLHGELLEKKEQLRLARVESFRNKKLVMNRLGKTVELIVKLENTLDDESKVEQKSKLRDQLETRGLEAARDHEMLELSGTPQDIVDFRRKIAPVLCLHACPHCGDEMDPRGSSILDDMSDFRFICWDCEEEFLSPMAQLVDDRLSNGARITLDSNIKPRLKVIAPPSRTGVSNIEELIARDLKNTGASAKQLEAAIEASNLSGTLISIDEWIDQTITAKGYIQAQEHREEFIIATGAGATKFNKWMKKAGLYFNKQTGRWTRWEDR
ncbi:MAG: hypothetical protein ACKVHF_03315 [Candidatus Poseidoniales archaeon]|jgi:hypothetical protein|tara:strand:+ start:7070 stop:8161 length:1092 start_codon:yes stop_codon:yes gene_type:complete